MDIRSIFKKPPEVARHLGLSIDDQPQQVILYTWIRDSDDGRTIYGSLRLIFKNGSWVDYNTPVIENLAYNETTQQESEDVEFSILIDQIIDEAISLRMFSMQYKG